MFSEGLSFKKIDLHIHTPASKDFNSHAEPKDIVDEAIRKGLDAIAITDHNTGDWIDKIKEAAQNTPLTIFPGVEISCMGGEKNIHVIALFDIDKNSDYINSVLSTLEIKPDERGKQETFVKNKTIIDIIETIQNNWDGLVALAHVNSSSGVMGDMKGQPRNAILNHKYLFAVEATDFVNETKKNTKRRVIDLLDGTDPVYQRKLAVYQSSDNPSDDGGHCLEGIGTRFSYFKLDTISLDGLRQCFADPDVRIMQSFDYKEFAYPRIKEISISGGFLENQKILFHPGLNSILGGKGTGKSLIIELLRFALNQSPNQPDILADHQNKLAKRLGDYEFVEVTIIDETETEIKFKRTYQPAQNHPFNIDYDPAKMFPVLFLSQNEIIRIAEKENEQLAFIDQFFDFRTYKHQIIGVENELNDLDKKMADCLNAFPIVSNLNTQIMTLEEDIKRIDAALKHPIFEKLQTLEKKETIFTSQTGFIDFIKSSTTTNINKVSELQIPEIPKEFKNDAALRRNLDTINKIKNEIIDELSKTNKSILEIHQKIHKEYETWKPQLERAKEEYESHIQSSGGDLKSLAVEREQKNKQLGILLSKLKDAQQKKESIATISRQREKLLDDLEKVYSEYTTKRKQKCIKFQEDSTGRLKLFIHEGSNKEVFRDKLLELKKGSYLKDTEIEKICNNIRPRELILSLLRYAASSQKKTMEEIAKNSDIQIDRMISLASFLLESIDYEELLKLQYKATPQDTPEILFNIGNEEYRALNEVSVGQKSIALLIMALSDGQMPVIIDQPEDSLDIRSIWEDVCLKVRNSKTQRQFISTTHSSSVAVSSDTDKFIILESSANKGNVIYSGSMDSSPISDEVIKYLEGGVESYRRKHLKYQADRKLTK
jgi:hypothetical protein